MRSWSIKFSPPLRYGVLAILIVIFAAIGSRLLIASNAATPTSNVEVENGSLAGPATVVNDTSASGSKGVKFNADSNGTLVFDDEFNGTSLDTSKWTIKTGGESNSQAQYTAGNVTVANGYMDLRTQRNCVTSASDALSSANASTAPCPSGKITEYSSGNVWSGQVLPATGRIVVRAKLPSTELGLWPAIWLRNQNNWCTTLYGELDVMEWYGDNPNVDTATSHITCSGSSTVHVAHNLNLGSDVSSAWHTWTMNWSPSSIQYFIDSTNLQASVAGNADKTTDTYSDFNSVTPDTFTSVMNELWQLRLQTQVTQSTDQYHQAPDNVAPYQPADYLIDYVRVYGG